MSGVYVGLFMLAFGSCWYLFVRMLTPKPPAEKPTIKIIDNTRWDAGDLKSSPSDTMLLLWRLYPDALRGSFVGHPGFIHAQADGGKVYVFAILNGKPLIFEDDAAVFPSDALITKIRLVK